MIIVQTSDAHTPAWEIPTFAFINVSPDPVGVGQYVNVIMWLDKVPNAAAYTNDIRLHNYKLTITTPSGHTETKTWDVVIDTTSSQYYSYTPTETGNYTFKFEHLGTTYTWDGPYQNDTFLPSSATTSLTVQEEQITTISSYPLPEEYWTRPIYGENTDWWVLSSNWLGEGGPQTTASFSGYQVAVPDAVGSRTGHIMWTLPLQSGGVVGGDMLTVEGVTYFEGTAYIPRYTNPIILEGKLIYREPLSYGATSTTRSGENGRTFCRDLRTGELNWVNENMSTPSFGLIFDVQNQNEHGVCPPMVVSVVGTTWHVYDAFAGIKLCEVINVPTGTEAMGPNGEFLKYVIANAGTNENPDYRLCEWNSTLLFMPQGQTVPQTYGTIDASISSGPNNRYNWNVSLPWLTEAAALPDWSAASSGVRPHVANYNDLLLCHNGSFASGGDMFSPASWTPYNYFAINLNPDQGALGTLRWMKQFNPPPGNISTNFGGYDFEKHVFLEEYKETSQWVAYDMNTGNKLWGPTEPQNSWDYYGVAGVEDRIAMIAYGKVYSQFFSGTLYCYDEMTGELLWTYGNGGEGNSTASGYYGGYGVYPTAIMAIGNEVIYMAATEHTVSTPIYKGAKVRAVNAINGTELWTTSSFVNSFHTTSMAIADGFTTWWNGYDNQIYTTGRGPSHTTVLIQNDVIDQGSSVLIKGTVMDTATGTTQDEQIARFPDGVACVSDESMDEWMGYIYQQRPCPGDITGVTVSIDVLDANGNYRNIGTAKSDANGFYSLAWLPDIPGTYTVFANFAGTNGYWPSSAETSFAVDEVAPTQPTAVPQTGLATTSDLIMYLAIGFIATIIAIAIVGLLLLRKRP
ncbi:MAG: PQQ-binding-like beta-propeller repeat protein [Candidatus Bathyarchaeia archaeon]